MPVHESIPILFVDDRPEAPSLEAFLPPPEYRMIHLRSGKEALNHLRDEEPAVILLALRTLDPDGLETAKRIKQREWTRHVPIIFLTDANLDKTKLLNAYASGAADVISEPVDPDLFKARVSVFVELYKKRRKALQEQKERAVALAIENARLYQEANEEIAKRRETEKRWTAQHAITRVLAEAGSLNEAAPRILQAVCESFRWEMGALWLVHRDLRRLRCDATWHLPSLKMTEFNEACKKITFAPGEGLPGRIWATAEPAWIDDVAVDSNFPRESIAAREGLHGAFGFPIRRGTEFLGVLEFFSHDVREPDKELLKLMVGIGSQIGQFIERRWAEKALYESYTQLRLAVESARARLWMWDIPEDRIYFISPSPEGAPVNAYFGSFNTFLIRVHPEDRPAVRRASEGALTGESRYDVQFRFDAPDGSTPWYFGRAHITRNARGEPLRMYGLNIEITEQKQVEEQLKRKTIEAEESNRLKSQFVSSVSHDLKTPINAILGYSRLLLDGTYGPIDPEKRKPLESVVRNAYDLIQLIEDILDLSKIEAGKLSVHATEISLSRLIGEVVEGIRLLIEKKPLALLWDPLPDLPRIESDAGKIKQILANLLSNAVKYTPEGTVRIVGKDRPEKRGVEISVQDTGLGIPDEELPRLFDAYHQIDTRLAREHGSVGLGLKIVKDLVDLLKGEIRVESRSGEGSTFTVFLPYTWQP